MFEIDTLAVSVNWFSRMLTFLLPLFATPRSALPSPLKSAAAIAMGAVPVAKGELVAVLKAVPLPLPSMMGTVLSVLFVTAKSTLPSALKFPATMELDCFR
jgi:hypothetical protein